MHCHVATEANNRAPFEMGGFIPQTGLPSKQDTPNSPLWKGYNTRATDVAFQACVVFVRERLHAHSTGSSQHLGKGHFCDLGLESS